MCISAWEDILPNITLLNIAKAFQNAEEESRKSQLMKQKKHTTERHVKFAKKCSTILRFKSKYFDIYSEILIYILT